MKPANPWVMAAVIASGLAWTGPVAGQVCEESDTNSALQHLRRLSVDLRGRLPDLAEAEAVVAAGAVEPALIEAMLGANEFGQRVRAWHRDLLWTNLQRQRLQQNAWLLTGPGGRGGGAGAAWVRANNRSTQYRGGQVSCLDEPARFDADGQILTTRNRQGLEQEGWVEVEPYWAPGSVVRVCAFDAQDNLTAANPRNPDGPAVDCSRTVSPGCGCGPNLRWCGSGQQRTVNTIVAAMDEQLLRFAEAVVIGDRPYTDLILAKDMEINGPLVHYYRHQGGTGGNLVLSGPLQNFELPELSYDQGDTWVSVDRGLRHAGLLTMPGYLLKFQSNRGRANRFYNAFLCSPFQAPVEGLPAADNACHDEPNLTKRCGCKHCHVAVEPAAAHWGRWADAGQLALNEEEFPKDNPICATPRGARSGLCRRLYLTEANHPDEQEYLGALLPYVFADEVMQDSIAQGPGKLAQEAVDAGLFAECTVRKAWERLMHQPPAEADADALAAVTEAFIEGGYVYRDLIRALVTRPEYGAP